MYHVTTTSIMYSTPYALVMKDTTKLQGFMEGFAVNKEFSLLGLRSYGAVEIVII